ncbi:MAG: urea ABC transporter permease subunit UrtB [Roseobacter sp.]
MLLKAFRVIACLCFLTTLTTHSVQAQQIDAPIQQLLQTHGEIIAKSSRRTIGPAIDALAASGLDDAQVLLQRWQDKEMWFERDTGLFVFAEAADDGQLRIFDVAGGALIGEADKKTFKQLKPNSGIRGLIASALVQFQLSSADQTTRETAIAAIERDPDAAHLAALRTAVDNEPDAGLRDRITRLERLLTIRFGETDAARITAIQSFEADLSVDLRAMLNPLIATRIEAAPEVPENAMPLEVGAEELPAPAAYDILVALDLAPERISPEALRAVLVANIDGGTVAGVQVASLDTDDARASAYTLLAEAGVTAPLVTEEDVAAALVEFQFYQIFTGAPVAVAQAAQIALNDIETRLALSQTADLALDGLSLASIYFLAAIGLAITFGVMGVINMAHGEFIMMGAYTGYVVQLFVPDYTLSILLAIPLAFAVTFGAGVAMERLVIRWLYHRPLETLLATFGVSIALQQLAKNIFGTQARPLTSPAWLDGSWVINDVISISYIRIAIFVLALLFLALFLFVMKKTRLGLEVRAVTQNPRMAASMGINPDKINMLTFGFGSGIAGIAGVAIGLYSKVTSEMGSEYIVQSFMTVVVGGVGNIWGTLLGATMVGSLQKSIEWLNPSNTLAAQTYMILFIILFIQFRPRGIIALKGRAAEA